MMICTHMSLDKRLNTAHSPEQGIAYIWLRPWLLIRLDILSKQPWHNHDNNSVNYLNAHLHSSHLTFTNSLVLRQYICTTTCWYYVLQDFFNSTCKACYLTLNLSCDNCLKKYSHDFMSFWLELLQEQSLLSYIIKFSLFWVTQMTSSLSEAVLQWCLLLINSVNSNSADLKTFKLKWAHSNVILNSMSLVSSEHSSVSAFIKSEDLIHHVSMSLDYEVISFS